MKANDIGSSFDYVEEAFTYEEVGEFSGDTLLEFGAPWCGYCQAASTAIKEVVSDYAELRLIKIHDGKGKPLGRAFRVKLWPTLILVREGKEVARVVRPTSTSEVRQLVGSTGA